MRLLAYQVMDAAGLQRGRLTGLALRREDLVDAGHRHGFPAPSACPSGSAAQ